MLPPFDPWLSCKLAADVATVSRGNAAVLAQRQRQRLAALLQTAARRSALYEHVLRGRDPATVLLQQLPAVRKKELMASFDRWVCDPALEPTALRRFVADRGRIAQPFAGHYVVWESSGSTGEPGVFVQDAAAMAVYDALEGMRRTVLRPPAGGAMDPWLSGSVAFVGALDGHFASNVSMQRLRRLNPMLAGRLHSVSFLRPVREMVAELQALQPDVVATYPSAAVLLAEEQLAGRLELQLREVWTGGETLSPAMRHFVERAFGCPVINSYGASEFFTLASECRAGGMHLNSDWAILEPVDRHDRPVPPGQFGATTLVTNLANHVQPVIRYDIGDRVAFLPQACRCGSSLPLIAVQGRSDDTLRLGARGAHAVRVLPLALTTVLEDDAGLFDFQVVQQGPNELLLRTGLQGAEARRALPRARRTLLAFLREQGTTDVHVHCRSGEPGRRGRSGKVQRVVGM